ncbi:dynein axonemal assembly factor 6 [Gracilinanus agilis]|uniref:dynein axonemal assembly factor 6 n=1 Tax=Gracilinanus agilis TaxID=191870 RepID=UPI001CFC7F33|nr:dynein axonemal assembly factor 6 [Gracilinanus agilis]
MAEEGGADEGALPVLAFRPRLLPFKLSSLPVSRGLDACAHWCVWFYWQPHICMRLRLFNPPNKPENRKDIWDPEEVPEGSEFDDMWDPREQPEYDIIFKQHVGAEDVFLGMTRKDPSTACCEDLLVKIKLPSIKSSDITLDIHEKVLDLRTPKHKLVLHLPHPVDSKTGKASFITETEILEVTLTMKREFDFLNFF